MSRVFVLDKAKCFGSVQPSNPIYLASLVKALLPVGLDAKEQILLLKGAALMRLSRLGQLISGELGWNLSSRLNNTKYGNTSYIRMGGSR
jgi:hypothetical protein